MLAIEPNVARPKTAVKRRGGGHTTHEVSHCLLCSFCVSNMHYTGDHVHSRGNNMVARDHVHVSSHVDLCVMRGLPSTLGSTSRSLGSGNTPQGGEYFLMLTESA